MYTHFRRRNGPFMSTHFHRSHVPSMYTHFHSHHAPSCTLTSICIMCHHVHIRCIIALYLYKCTSSFREEYLAGWLRTLIAFFHIVPNKMFPHLVYLRSSPVVQCAVQTGRCVSDKISTSASALARIAFFPIHKHCR